MCVFSSCRKTFDPAVGQRVESASAASVMPIYVFAVILWLQPFT